MDYRTVELLLEKYWRAETTLDEEQALRDFFMNGSAIPAHLLPYRDFFAYQLEQQEIGLGADFDERMLERLEMKPVKARVVSWRMRLMPLLKAAAVLVGLALLGNVAQWAYMSDERMDYDYDHYIDTYDDPEAALKQVSSALRIVSEGLSKAESEEQDSLVVQPAAE